MNAQSLAWSASSSRAARSSAAPPSPLEAAASVRSSARRASNASPATRGESQVLKSLSLPQLDATSGRSTGSIDSSAAGSVTSSTPAAGASASTARRNSGPSYHQWPISSVSSAQQSR